MISMASPNSEATRDRLSSIIARSRGDRRTGSRSPSSSSGTPCRSGCVRGCVRLRQEAGLLQVGHDVPDARGTEPSRLSLAMVRDPTGSRSGCVIDDDLLEDFFGARINRLVLHRSAFGTH